MQSRAHSSFAEPQPPLAILYCKGTINNRENQTFPRFFSHKDLIKYKASEIVGKEERRKVDIKAFRR